MVGLRVLVTDLMECGVITNDIDGTVFVVHLDSDAWATVVPDNIEVLH